MASFPVTLLVNTLALRPAANTLPAGVMFYAWDTAQFFENVLIDGVNTRGWVAIGGAAPTLGPEITVAPLVDQELVVAVPDVTGFADGDQILYVFTPVNRGAAVGVLTAFAGQTIGPTFPSYRLHEEGTVMLRATPASLRWDIAGEKLGTPQNLTLAVATTGSDLNPGTVASPVLTMQRALNIMRTARPREVPTINVAAGTFAQGANPKWSIPSPLGVNSQPPRIVCPMVDSGLGTQTVGAGSVQGTGSTFGAAVDAAGGLVVNAWRGWVLRWTGGTAGNLGRSYRVFKNDATTFTIAGSFAALPAPGDTFVIERPATVFSFTGTMTIDGGVALGLINAAFDAGGTGAMRVTMTKLAMQTTDFRNLGGGGVQIGEGAEMVNLLAETSFTVTGIPQVVGPYLQSAVSTSAIRPETGAHYNVSRAVHNGVAIESIQSGGYVQLLDAGITGAAWMRSASSLFSLSRVRMETVTPAPVSSALVSAQGAAVVICKQGFGSIINTDISNTPATTAPGDGILCCDSAEVDLTATIGTGNAGIGLEVRRHSQLRDNSGSGANTIAGAGGQCKIGANAAVNFAALPANNNDLAAGIASELCLSTTP